MSIKLAILIILALPEFYLSKSRLNTVKKNAEYVVELSKKHNFDPMLIFALIYVESGWKKTVVSSAGACGLTQVLPKYTGNRKGGKNPAGVEKLSCDQLKNPRISIRAGIKTLSWWRKYHNGNISRALCSYNAGFRCGSPKRPRARPNRSGMRYSRKVIRYKNKFLEKYNLILAK
tara:strand:- start:25135 stop:25659 length:525 start_codon:yes stop_codon:yes gene_type:complete